MFALDFFQLRGIVPPRFSKHKTLYFFCTVSCEHCNLFVVLSWGWYPNQKFRRMRRYCC